MRRDVSWGRYVWEGTWVGRHTGHGSSGRTEAQEEGVVFSWGGLYSSPF